jgi:branched-chain amino acid aminotransferase
MSQIYYPLEGRPLFGKGKIWFDGKMVDWKKATIHVLSHVIHYGSSVFEGIRCYSTSRGPAVFRLEAHVDRLYDSAKIYRMDIPYTKKQINQAIIKVVKINKLKACYIRPIVFRGYGSVGVYPLKNPLQTAIAAWDWGSYLGEESLTKGISVRISSWQRPAPNTFPTLSKAGGNYLNSQLVKMEAVQDGFDEGIALDHYGYVSEGSGENVFIVKNGVIFTPPTNSSILAGITRHSIFVLARELGVEIRQQVLPRESLYIADEVFLTGTAAEIVPVSKIDNIVIGEGKRGPVTTRVQKAFFDILHGETPDRFEWLTPVA